MRTAALMLVVVVLWEWLATAGTRLIVAQSPWSLAVGGVNAAVWWLTIGFSGRRVLVYPVVVGTVVGTWLGITWP